MDDTENLKKRKKEALQSQREKKTAQPLASISSKVEGARDSDVNVDESLAIAGGPDVAVLEDGGLMHDVTCLPDSEIASDIDYEKVVTYDDLRLFTNGFCDENFIGDTQYGKLYKGKIPQGWKERFSHDEYVTIKTWGTKTKYANGLFYDMGHEYVLARMKDEIKFMGLPFVINSQFVPEIMGYCLEENELGVVYNVNTLNSLCNLIPVPATFRWHHRVKLALQLAKFIQLCHARESPYLIRNLSVEHIIMDQDLKPYLVDFAMILGGGLGDDTSPCADVPVSSYHYYDTKVVRIGSWLKSSDLFAFGSILFELLYNLTCPLISCMAKDNSHVCIADRIRGYYAYLKRKDGGEKTFSAASGILRRHPEYDSNDGIELTMVGLNCIRALEGCPRLEEVICTLEKLKVLAKHGGML